MYISSFTLFLLNFFSGVTIGFRVADVQVPLGAEEAILTVELTGAQLDTNIQIQFNTVNGTAIGGKLKQP